MKCQTKSKFFSNWDSKASSLSSANTHASVKPGKNDSPSLEDAEDCDESEPLNILERAFLYSSSRSSMDFDFLPSIERRE